MIRMVRFMHSYLKCNNTSWKMLSHLALQGSDSHMYKSLNNMLFQLKLDAMTFCNMKSKNLYEMDQDHHQEGLDEQLMCKVSFAKDVLESTDNACSTSFLFIDELRSILAVLCTQ